MKARRIVLLSMFFASGVAFFEACGGSSTTIGNNGSDASSPSDGNTSANDSATPNDAATSTDASTDASASDANDDTDGTIVNGNDGGDGGACNTLDPSGEKNIAVDFGGADAPVPTGGTITPGTYHLARVTIYGADLPDSGATGVIDRGLLQFTATTFASATITTAAGSATTRRDSYGTYVVDADGGKAIDVTQTCPKTDSDVIGYSVDVTGIRLRTEVAVGTKTYDAEEEYTP